MYYGFKQNCFERIELPAYTDHLLIDDCTLAFFLGCRNKTLWYHLVEKEAQYKVYSIPKKTPGKFRIIHAPSDNMKRILKNAHKRLLVPLEESLGEHVTAYRPNRSARDAVQHHLPPCEICDAMPRGKRPKKHECPREGTMFKMDLQDFFHSTRRSWIRAYFTSLGYSFHVSDLIASLLTVKLGTQEYSWNGTPQGAPTSGSICNLVADQILDQPILGYLQNLSVEMGLDDVWQWRYSRYADDLTFTCGKKLPKEKLHEVIEQLATIINASGYRVNLAKTKVQSPNFRRQILGIVANQKPNFPYEEYLKLRAITHNCLTEGIETQHKRSGKETVAEFIPYLRGKISYVYGIHEYYGAKLKEVFDAAVEIWDAKNTEVPHAEVG
jgi:retron-type reverse transcriptase